MTKSPAYVLGALDVLVKAGEVSPAFAAGVASVLTKDAQVASSWWQPWDTEAENLQQQYNSWLNNNQGARNAQNGQITMSGDQVKQMVDKARPWYDNMWGRMGANMKHWGRMAQRVLPEAVTGKQMTADESRQMLEYDRNKFRQDFLNRTQGAGNSAVYGAAQDQFTRDAETAWRTAGNFMSDAERTARFGETADDAKNKFRTAEGTAAMQGGIYKPTYDKQSAQPKTKSIQNNPLSSMYGSKDRQRLYSGKFRNGLGMF